MFGGFGSEVLSLGFRLTPRPGKVRDEFTSQLEHTSRFCHGAAGKMM